MMSTVSGIGTVCQACPVQIPFLTYPSYQRIDFTDSTNILFTDLLCL